MTTLPTISPTTTALTSPAWQGFLADIRANPDDDVVRLTASDWLRDQGAEELAEFIRLQIELAHEEPGYALDFWTDVKKVHGNSANMKIRQALDLCQKVIYSVWEGGMGVRFAGTWGFRNGFLSSVRSFSLDQWVHDGPELVSHPWVALRSLKVTEFAPFHLEGLIWRFPVPPHTTPMPIARITSIIFPDEKSANAMLSDLCIRWATDEARKRGLIAA